MNIEACAANPLGSAGVARLSNLSHRAASNFLTNFKMGSEQEHTVPWSLEVEFVEFSKDKSNLIL